MIWIKLIKKNKLKLSVIIYFSLNSCNFSQKEIIPNKTLTIDVIDSIKINFKSKELQAVAYNKDLKYYLFIDQRSVDTILIIDNKGNIINKYNPKTTISNLEKVHVGSVGFYQNEILVSTSNNIYLFNLNGEINRILFNSENLDIWNYNKKIKNISHIDDQCYVFQYLKTNVSDATFSRNFYKKTNVLTHINFRNNSIEPIIPYENSSILHNAIYGQNITYFDYNKKDSLLYVLNNPDPSNYIYKPLKKPSGKINYKFVKKINIYPNNLPLLLSYKFNKRTLPDYTRLVSINGQFMSLDLLKNGESFITYMNEELFQKLFDSSISEKDKSESLIKNVKFFGKIVDNDGISNEIQLPKFTQNVGLVMENNILLLNPSPFIINTNNYTVFYLSKLNIE